MAVGVRTAWIRRYTSYAGEIMNKAEIFNAVIFSYSDEKEDIVKAMSEWQRGLENKTHKTSCICTTEISRNYHVMHMRTGVELVIGSCCIRKFGDDIPRLSGFKGRLWWARSHCTPMEQAILKNAETERTRCQMNVVERITGRPIPKNWTVNDNVTTAELTDMRMNSLDSQVRCVRLEFECQNLVKNAKARNPWEMEFLDCVKTKRTLSERQLAVLRRMQ